MDNQNNAEKSGHPLLAYLLPSLPPSLPSCHNKSQLGLPQRPHRHPLKHPWSAGQLERGTCELAHLTKALGSSSVRFSLLPCKLGMVLWEHYMQPSTDQGLQKWYLLHMSAHYLQFHTYGPKGMTLPRVSITYPECLGPEMCQRPATQSLIFLLSTQSFGFWIFRIMGCSACQAQRRRQQVLRTESEVTGQG